MITSLSEAIDYLYELSEDRALYSKAFLSQCLSLFRKHKKIPRTGKESPVEELEELLKKVRLKLERADDDRIY